MNQKTFLDSDDQFIVSYELLYILQWLMIYEKDALAELIFKACKQGSDNLMFDVIAQGSEEQQELSHSVIDFFSFLEEEVEKFAQNSSIEHIMEHNLLQTLDHIDPKRFDPALIKATMMTTAEKINPAKNHMAKDYFLKELLRKWQPKKECNKKHILN